MTPPDVAALLARHPEPWSVGCLGGVYDADFVTIGGRENGPSAATLVPLLATALRAALADQRRWRAVKEQMIAADFAWGESNESVVVFSLPNGMTVSANPDHYADQLVKAYDAATTADGGGV